MKKKPFANFWWARRGEEGDGLPDPTTIIEIYGEDYNGTTLTPTVGGSTTKNGSYTSGASLGKTSIFTATSGSEFIFDDVPNADADNYIVFSVSKYSVGSSSGVLFDFAQSDASAYRMIIETRNGNGDGYNGYLYGTSSQEGAFVDLTAQGENNDEWKIRMWVFQGGKGNLYLNGGSSIYTDDWLPTPLGGTGRSQKFHRDVASGQQIAVCHASIHKFDALETVSLTWANNYGNALNAFYTGLSWTDITEW